MKIVAFNGSPRKTASCATLIESLCAGARGKGHETRVFHLIDHDVKPCIACYSCMGHKAEICSQNDDFIGMAKEIMAADVVVMASPVYMGQVTGLFKTFFDRWLTFAEADFSIRHVVGKRFVTIVTSGAPPEQFKEVTAYLKHWVGDFFKLKHAGSLVAGDLHEPGDIRERHELLREAEALGRSL